MRPLFAEATYPLANAQPKFIGEIIQRFNIRKGRAAKPYRDNINEIKNIVQNKFVPEIANCNMLFSRSAYEEVGIPDDFCLLELKDFQGLLPKSHEAGVPVFALTSEQIGYSGDPLTNMEKNRDDFAQDFKKLANQIIGLEKYAKSI
jgi:hypothetical protein